MHKKTVLFFLTFDTRLQATDPLRFRKSKFDDQIKILGKKIMKNEAQYNLDRKTAKISASSSNNFNKYEYLIGEDLGLKPSTVEQARFDYSPLSKFLNKGLKEEEKEEGALKILKNVEDKNKKQLKEIEYQENEQLNAIKNINTNSKSSKMIVFLSRSSPDAEKLLKRLKKKKMILISKNLFAQNLVEKFLTLILLNPR